MNASHLFRLYFPSNFNVTMKSREHLGLSTSVCASNCNVFVLSDLHTDYPENMEWIKSLPDKNRENDALIVAGDVAESYKIFVETMSHLKKKYNHVFFVPGNHDLWCRREEGIESLTKMQKLLDACRELGVQTKPSIIGGLGIVPLFSWYHESFDKEADITGVRIPPLEMACKDFDACKWPPELSGRDMSLAIYFDAMNHDVENDIDKIRKSCDKMITFSHFVPRQELCPEKRMLFYPNLPKMIGSDLLEARIRGIHEDYETSKCCHVFGHTHFMWDAVVQGIRYVQVPLAYPRERKRTTNGGRPFCLFSDGNFSYKLSSSYWSDYYAQNPRTPQNVQLAPWVARFYKSRIPSQ